MLWRIFSIISMAFVLLMSGCSTPARMALSNYTDTVSKTGKPIYLMTVTLRNNYKTSYQPELTRMQLEKAVGTSKEDNFDFEIDEKAKDETNRAGDGNSYLLRMALVPDTYVFRGMISTSGIFPVRGTFYTPLHAQMIANGHGVFYLGHVDATVRERRDGEFRAGRVIPLLDQAVTGASTGTFDVDISDNWEKDEPKFQAKFPALRNVSIQSAVLPPFDRAKAQKSWDTGKKFDEPFLVDEHTFEEKQSNTYGTNEKTDFAKLSDVAALPYVNSKARENYRMFLRAGYPRAFVIAEDGGWAWMSGLPKTPSDPKDPLERAMQLCAKLGHQTCRPYAINGQIVW